MIGHRLGNYRITGRLESVHAGGAVECYAATHVVLPRRVCIKIAAGAARVPLLREACALEAIAHAGVPRVFESGLLPDERPWTAVEIVEGERASELVRRGPLPPGMVIALVREVARVLAHAHARGVVHAGLRPERIVRGDAARGGVCIVDWSDARAHDAAASLPRLPTAEARAYLAPEALRGEALDDRADVLALGVMAFQALTGALPGDAPRPLRELCPRAPRELVVVVDQMLARDRFDRPSAVEVVAELARVHEGAHDGARDTLRDLPVVDEVELVDTDGVPASVQPMPRLRAPRWTPQHLVTCEDHESVSGEIEILGSRT